MALRKIIHVDMDAFYASVEQRDDPALLGRPVIVGGDPNSRGVVAACSYEARAFGIHSAMPASRAFRLCPHAVFLRPRFDAYTRESRRIREIFHEYTDLVQPLSLDEAYLDVTENKKGIETAYRVAQEIRRRIFETTGLTASAGVSFNKFLAKVASDVNKPNGITVVTPEDAPAFIDRLPIGKFHGIGKVTEAKMLEMGIHSGADLKRFSREGLIDRFGKAGAYYHDIAHGKDDRPVNPDRERKSVGKETTFGEDTIDKGRLVEVLAGLAEAVEAALDRHETAGRTVTLKVKYFDFQQVTRSATLEAPVNSAAAIMARVEGLLDKTEAGTKRVRLVGITVSNLTDGADEGGPLQLKLPFPPVEKNR